MPSSCTAAAVEPSWVSAEAAAVTGVAQQMILVRTYSCCAAEGEEIADLHARTHKCHSSPGWGGRGEEGVEEEEDYQGQSRRQVMVGKKRLKELGDSECVDYGTTSYFSSLDKQSTIPHSGD